MKVAVIDNYDSFAYNLVHYLEDLNAEVTVFRNDELEVTDLEKFDKYFYLQVQEFQMKLAC